jgi:outer membrane protein assembly factor BamD
MVDAYDELGMNDMRDDVKRVIEKTFSNNQESSDLVTSNSESWWKFW